MKKQIVLIMVDSQRQDMLSCYSGGAWPTPHLDGLAAEGTRFTKAYTCQPVCGPARSALFTGLYPHSNGMWGNSMQLGQNVKNAGEWLAGRSIARGYIGKWHLDGGDYFGYGKCPAGYDPDYWYDMRNYLDEFPPEERTASRENMTGVTREIRAEDTYAHRCSDRALRFLDAHKEQDFFLTLSYDEPHDPSQCPQSYLKELRESGYQFPRTPNVEDSLEGKPAHQRVWAEFSEGIDFATLCKNNEGFLACNRFVDDEIGRVVEKIRTACPDAMVIYTADHGEMFLSHHLIGKGAAMYDEITKVPFLIRGGGFPSGAVYETPVSHIDLLPTVLDYFSLPIPRMLQGRSLLHHKEGKPRDIFMEFTRYEVDHDGFMGFQPIRCIFDGRYKLVLNLLTSDELYDLKEDPCEMENRVEDPTLSTVRDALHDRLIEQMNQTRDPMRGYYWHCRPWRKGPKPSFHHTGYTRQLEEEDFVQLDYSTGLAMTKATRKK